MCAQAIADHLGMGLAMVGTAEIQSSEPGGAERAIKQVFADARGKKTVILFDECDSLLTDRDTVGVILGAQINALLTEIERHDGVVVFTTNRLGTLDPALERRISAKIEFPFPDHAQRRAIWQRLIPAKAPLADDVDLDALAHDHAIAGGNIKNAVLNAARMAAYQEAGAITHGHFAAAARKEVASVSAFAAAAAHSPSTTRGGYVRDDNHEVAIERVPTRDAARSAWAADRAKAE